MAEGQVEDRLAGADGLGGQGDGRLLENPVEHGLRPARRSQGAVVLDGDGVELDRGERPGGVQDLDRGGADGVAGDDEQAHTTLHAGGHH